MLKQLIEKIIDCKEAPITIEQARRLINYAQKTYFKHLRLYDFVLKNSKTSEKKFIKIPLVVPQMGAGLEHAMVITD